MYTALLLFFLLPLTIPLFLSNLFINTSHGQEWEPVSPFRLILAIILPLVISQWGYHRKNLSSSGAASAFLLGCIMTLSSYSFMTSMIAFFLAGSRVTKWRSVMKRKLEAEFNDGQRSWMQVVCNGGVAAELALIHLIDSGSGERFIDFQHNFSSSWLSMSLLGALACCSGDTFSSEIGSVVGNAKPRLITTFKRVPKGTNGGVSIVGTLSSVLGGFVVGLVFWGTQAVLGREAIYMTTSPPQWPIVLVTSLAGLFGSIVDSLLGATLQYSGLNVKTGCIVESPGEGVQHITGHPLLNNHGVNLLSSVITCLFAPQMSLAIWRYVA